MKSSAANSSPSRTCIGCRLVVPQSQLVRLIERESTVKVDETSRSSGRGAYIHPNQDCLSQAITRKAFSRAFRKGSLGLAEDLRDTVMRKHP